MVDSRAFGTIIARHRGTSPCTFHCLGLIVARARFGLAILCPILVAVATRRRITGRIHISRRGSAATCLVSANIPFILAIIARFNTQWSCVLSQDDGPHAQFGVIKDEHAVSGCGGCGGFSTRCRFVAQRAQINLDMI